MTSIRSSAHVAAVLAAIFSLGPIPVFAQQEGVQPPVPQGTDQSPVPQGTGQSAPPQGLDQSPVQEEMEQEPAQPEMEQLSPQQGMEMMRGGMMHHGRMGRMRSHMPSQHMLKILFAIADTNGDGAISFEELSAIQKRIFDLIDTNHDGKITLDELNAFLQN